MLQLNRAAGAGGRTDAASGADRLDDLGDLLAAAQCIFHNGAERTGLETLKQPTQVLVLTWAMAGSDSSMSLEKSDRTLAAAALPCVTDAGMSFRPWHAPARKTPEVFVSTGLSFGMALNVEPVCVIGDMEFLGHLRRAIGRDVRQWQAQRGLPPPPPVVPRSVSAPWTTIFLPFG